MNLLQFWFISLFSCKSESAEKEQSEQQQQVILYDDNPKMYFWLKRNYVSVPLHSINQMSVSYITE
jgi:hypothetical protein